MGANNGLHLLLDAETFDYGSSPATSAQGFTISLLHHLDIPIMKQSGISVDPGQSLRIAVTPTRITTTSASKRRFSPQQRKCFFEDEVSLAHFPPIDDYRYEMSNCLFEATLQKIERVCGCTPKNFIEVATDYQACTGKGKKCMNELMQDMGDARTFTDDGVEKECLAACEDQTFQVLVTQSSYPNEHTFRQKTHFCVLVDKLTGSCSGTRRIHLDKRYPDLCRLVELHTKAGPVDRSPNTTFSCPNLQVFEEDLDNKDQGGGGNGLLDLQRSVTAYARENVASVTVFIRDPYAAHYERDETITEISFVGTVGGLLGLFLGFSWISAVEVVFLCLGLGRRGGAGKTCSSPDSSGQPSVVVSPAKRHGWMGREPSSGREGN